MGWPGLPPNAAKARCRNVPTLPLECLGTGMDVIAVRAGALVRASDQTPLVDDASEPCRFLAWETCSSSHECAVRSVSPQPTSAEQKGFWRGRINRRRMMLQLGEVMPTENIAGGGSISCALASARFGCGVKGTRTCRGSGERRSSNAVHHRGGAATSTASVSYPRSLSAACGFPAPGSCSGSRLRPLGSDHRVFQAHEPQSFLGCWSD